MAGDVPSVTVEVAYANPASQALIELQLPVGSTLRDAIEASGILARYPEIDLDRASVGVFGKLAPLSQVLNGGDRVEIYRPLLIEPTEARRQRAKKGVKS